MFGQDERRFAQVRSVAGLILLTLVLAAGVGYWLYGPYFRLRDVQVSGTTLVNPESVRAWVEHDIHRLRWLILPGDHSILLSTSSLSTRLRSAITKRLSVEKVEVEIRDRHQLAIHITEREPLFVWKSGESTATIDRNGIIIGVVKDGDQSDIPTVIDQTNLPIPTDQQIVQSEVINSFTTLEEERQKSGLAVEHYVLPHPTCVKKEEPVVLTNSSLDTNQASNTNSVEQETNTNVSANVNSSVPVIVTCDTPEARLASAEVWMKLKDGPTVYFDRYTDIRQAYSSVVRALQDPKNYQAGYIDARFSGRLFIK